MVCQEQAPGKRKTRDTTERFSRSPAQLLNFPVRRVKSVESMSVTQLKTLCKQMDLPIYGCKRTLCQRVLTAQSSSALPSVISSTFSSASTLQHMNPISPTNRGMGGRDMHTFYSSSQGFAPAASTVHINSSKKLGSISSITDLKLVELRAKCKEVGLPSSGRKQELLTRLDAYYEASKLEELNHGTPNDKATDRKVQPSSENTMRVMSTPADTAINPFGFSWDFLDVEPKGPLSELCGDEKEGFDFVSRPGRGVDQTLDTTVSSAEATLMEEINSGGRLTDKNKVELVEICKTLKLKEFGKKLDLVRRITAFLERNTAASEGRLPRSSGVKFDGFPGHLDMNSSLRPFSLAGDQLSQSSNSVLFSSNFANGEAKRKRQKGAGRKVNSAAVDETKLPPPLSVASNNRTRSTSLNAWAHSGLGEVFELEQNRRFCANDTIPRSVTTRNSALISSRIAEVLQTRYYVLEDNFITEIGRTEWICSILDTREAEKVFTATINQSPQCNCEEFGKGLLCSHILYLYLRVLKYSTREQLIYQPALTTSELADVWKRLKVKNDLMAIKSYNSAVSASAASESENETAVYRENWVDQTCGICFEALNTSEDLVWCENHCGKNLHQDCMSHWLARREREQRICPFCKDLWPVDDYPRRRRRVL